MALSIVAGVLLSGSIAYAGTEPSTTTTSTTTTIDPAATVGGIPGPAEVSGEILPTRGTSVQLTPTVPAPATTTTTHPTAERRAPDRLG